MNVLSHTCPQAWPGGRKAVLRWRVGYSSIDTLKEVAAQQVSDQQLETARFRFPYNTPTSKEAYLYRKILKNCSRFRAPLVRAWRSFRRAFFR
ncbi:hypothetical protein ACVXG8_01440 [Escherichia coli]